MMQDVQDHFNPLPPHGGRLNCTKQSGSRNPFQSTPSAWRETLGEEAYDKLHEISIHSLRMEGDYGAAVDPVPYGISIHSLRMEGDV